MEQQIPLSSPDIDPSDIEAVIAVLRSTQLSLGPTGPRFEQAFVEYTGARHAVAVNSGTSGLHLAVIALGIGAGDEVVTTPFSFVASTNCFLFEGAKPVFADIDPVTWDLDPAAAEAAITPRTKALLPVHVFGRPCRIGEFVEIARRRGLRLLEDPCESLGSAVRGRMTGTFGDAGVFAFYPNKQITTGEGGVIVTDDDTIAGLCRSLRNQGRDAGGGWLEHVRMGFNYRLSDIQAALGLSQMARLESFVAMRQRVFQQYGEALRNVGGVIAPAPARPDERVSWFVYVVRLADEFDREDRDAVLAQLRRRGIGCRNYFVPIHLQGYMRERFGFREGQFPVTEAVAARSIALPFHNRVGEAEIEAVAGALREAIDARVRARQGA
ncbi:MAG TPA: DegT/DnrJ/EryC1/StrS family aminotransferase [Candidatus Polarisedimenticolaceae bacterium]